MNEFTISEHLSCLGISLSKKKGGGGGVKADYHDLSQTLQKWGLWSLKSVSTQSPIEKKKKIPCIGHHLVRESLGPQKRSLG